MNKKVVKKNKNLKIEKFSKGKKKKSKKARLLVRRIFILVLCVASVALLLFGISLLLNKVFVVHSVAVEGKTAYTEDEIIKHGGISKGSSFIFLNVHAAEEKIYKSLPYIDEVKVSKELPDKIKVVVTPADPQYVLCFNNEYLIVSKHDKLLEKSSELPPELVNIIGAKITVSESGKVKYENENVKKLLVALIDTFKESGLNGMKSIDISDVNNVVINYDNRLKIEIGADEDLNYKVITAKEIIMNKIGSSEKGTLDLKSLKKENRSYFTSEE